MNYKEFLESKRIVIKPSGFTCENINPKLFDFQRDIVKWALKKGKAAVFCGTGLGKTPIQLSWAKCVYEYTGKDVLILAPLAVAKQTQREGLKFNIEVTHCREQSDVKPGVNITNYEMLHRFDLKHFEGVVLDESSILKSFTGKVRNQIIDSFKNTPYKLACTATPAPNDHMELGNHAEFLGVMSRSEMLSMFFVHDGGRTSQWRLKKHAKKDFWEWVASWAVMMSIPSDLGYENGKFELPPLNIKQITVKPKESSFVDKDAKTLGERRQARRESLNERILESAKIANATDDPVIVWCDLNLESDLLKKQINNSTEINGSHDHSYKEEKMLGFTSGEVKKLVTKPSIAGFGMNWQHCNKMIFTGLSDSFEQYYQAVRRCWRFGQEKPVEVRIITSEAEGAVVKNIERKEQEFKEMLSGMISATQEITKQNIRQLVREEAKYMQDIKESTNWKMIMGDSIEETSKMDEESIDYIMFSPPFKSLYTYSNSERDMGNCKTDDEFDRHFSYLVPELFRVLKPGRLVSIHCMDLPSMKERDGVIGLKDFPGQLIKIFQEAGFIYHSRVTIWKNPATEMQRTKALGLLHKQLRKDSSMCRNGIPDYIITLRKPGENLDRITHTKESYPVDKWREIASPVWMNINQSNTLQRKSARAENDERHIAPLQLDSIEKCLELWTNPGDIVYDPFAGIGSVPYTAVKMGRYGLGCELKESYYNQAYKNLENIEKEVSETNNEILEEDISSSLDLEKREIITKDPLVKYNGKTGQIDLFDCETITL